MPVTKLVSEVSFGGNAVNNPTNYSWTDYRDYPNLDLTKSYVRMNVIYLDSKLQVYMEVTGLITLNAQGFPLMSPNDLVQMPCPPAC